jgi:thymidylate synthase ThyX
VLESSLGARYVGDMDRMFDTYRTALPELQAWLTKRFPQGPGDSDFVYRQSIRAKALDALRGLLPAASLSNVGIYGTGQSYEMLLLRMRAHPLPEVRRYAPLMLEELRKVIPSFLQRVDIPERGGVWTEYLADTAARTDEVVQRLWPDAQKPPEAQASGVRLMDWDPEGEDKVIAAVCYPRTSLSDQEVLRRVRALGAEDRRAIMAAYVGERVNRRHRPGRAFERTGYRFDVVSDYGAFRDLQRHRMLTIECQDLGPALGYEMPETVIEAGMAERYERSMARSAQLYEVMTPVCPAQAPYAVALAYRVRYAMQMNAREAMHMLELRSGEQGHPAYRVVAQDMHRLIAEHAGHRVIAEAMTFVDHASYDLERLESEKRAEARRSAAVPT